MIDYLNAWVFIRNHPFLKPNNQAKELTIYEITTRVSVHIST